MMDIDEDDFRDILLTLENLTKDYLHSYIPEEFKSIELNETRERIKKHGGTLGYIADINEKITGLKECYKISE